MKSRYLIVVLIALLPIVFMITLAYILDKRQKLEPGGETIYMHYCSGCHGKTGDGRGISAKVKRLDPPNFRDPEFWELANEEDLLEIIRDGQDKMPAFEKFIIEPDRRSVLGYIKDKFRPDVDGHPDELDESM